MRADVDRGDRRADRLVRSGAAGVFGEARRWAARLRRGAARRAAAAAAVPRDRALVGGDVAHDRHPRRRRSPVRAERTSVRSPAISADGPEAPRTSPRSAARAVVRSTSATRARGMRCAQGGARRSLPLRGLELARRRAARRGERRSRRARAISSTPRSMAAGPRCSGLTTSSWRWRSAAARAGNRGRCCAMRDRFRGWEDSGLPPDVPGTVLTVGTFDGMHRGHLDILRTVAARADASRYALRPRDVRPASARDRQSARRAASAHGGAREERDRGREWRRVPRGPRVRPAARVVQRDGVRGRGAAEALSHEGARHRLRPRIWSRP